MAHNDNHGGHDHGPNGREPQGLTRNEMLVWETLTEAESPLKAYEILDKLKDKGVRAPMTVYRALEGLEQKGYIHKLEGINAFVTCKHEGPHEVQVFLVCESCASANEVELDIIESNLRPLLRRSSFQMKTARLEARGLCRNCQTPAAA
ncbi:MAG TPA: Fur family transcriptional regulator [Parvularculaceae bacterium]|nr:Fur family transcriptional regulator [Parvularculaceae bacterium]